MPPNSQRNSEKAKLHAAIKRKKYHEKKAQQKAKAEALLRIEQLEKTRDRVKSHREQKKKIIPGSDLDKKSGNSLTTPHLSDDQISAINEFESRCKAIKHKHCPCCHMVSLHLKLTKTGVCTKCNGKETDHYVTKSQLPTWHDETGVIRFDIPEELSCLTLAEKMLIQRVSPLVPLQHIKNGTFGLSGHVCAFEQDVSDMATVLPRSISDATVIKVFKMVKAEITSKKDPGTMKCFRVRPSVVLRALHFLKKFSSEYHDIVIDESRLKWIKTGHGDLTIIAVEEPMTGKRSSSELNEDQGPAKRQCIQPTLTATLVKDFGTVTDSGVGKLNQEDAIINHELQEALAGSGLDHDGMNWPAISSLPVNEYSTTKIFARAFPWLYPGGVGDIKDHDKPERILNEWGKMMLYHRDGRFATDKLFTFFCLNYIVRHRNATSGGFFMEKFVKNPPPDLESLKKQLASGNTSFLRYLSYYNKRIKGSTSYWFQKRSELFAWINQHVLMGNGAPTFFITLSCAEYFWPDVVDLLRDRLIIAGIDPDKCKLGSPSFVQMCNDFSIVIQEYFQLRTEAWLETVGKKIFDIKHYWVRYEFAPGRGQIHAHLLGISNDQTIYSECYNDLQQQNGHELRAQRLAKWAFDRFGLTAWTDTGFGDHDIEDLNNPVTVRFSDLDQTKDSLQNDGQKLLQYCQVHECSGFCMKSNHKSSKKRVCRSGCGMEQTAGKCDTPGMDLSTEPKIGMDHKRTRRLYMPRNHARVNQTSMVALQSWRGNCDVQIIVYDCDPKSPSISEIARITDYVVSYACKGNCTTEEEKQLNKELILGAEDVTGDKQDLKRVSKMLMNRSASQRIISKQEACVLLGDLDLVTCSETIVSVSISDSSKIRLKDPKDPKEGGSKKSILDEYKAREANYESLSLNDYFHLTRNHPDWRGEKKIMIPHYVGCNSTPCYPPSEPYARHTLIVHKPWRRYPNQSEWIPEFERFINSDKCPMDAKISYQRVMMRYMEKTVFCEPKAAPTAATDIGLTQEDNDLMILAGLHGTECADLDEALLASIERGIQFNWGKNPKVRMLKFDVQDFDQVKILYGVFYNNKMRNLTSTEVKPEDWLSLQISNAERESTTELDLPKRDDGKDYNVNDLYPDQEEIVAVVLGALREFLECEDPSTFVPLRITIMGQGGSGKSVVINTIVAVMRRMFNYNDVVRVVAPTGTAAYNVNGETFHHLLQIGIGTKSLSNMTNNHKPKLDLLKKFRYLLALIIDERSMVSSQILGTANKIISESLHDGGHLRHKSWGGLPIVVLVGDDYQLPTIGEGALTALYNRSSTQLINLGRRSFLECTDYVLGLATSKRLHDNKMDDKILLDRLRDPDHVQDEDINRLLNLHLDVISRKHGKETVEDIKARALYLFYRNDRRIRHNLQRLAAQGTVDNPVAFCRCQCTGTARGKSIRSHFDADLPSTSLFCVGAKVSIENRNLKPNWGLHNGAGGTVEEIVFAPGSNPNAGDLPLYVVVNFPGYKGPVWDKDNPKSIPIAPNEFHCNRKERCCTRRFIPLTVAYARTIHRFQGMSAGPVDVGKIPNCYDVIVCDPDQREFEGKALGLLYTATSRATTLGDKDSGLHSAIYFDGIDFNINRIKNMTKRQDNGQDFELVKKRKKWVAHLLLRNQITLSKTAKTRRDSGSILNWATSKQVSLDQLHRRIITYKRANTDKPFL